MLRRIKISAIVFFLFILLFPLSMGSVALPPKMIILDKAKVRALMHYHGVLWIRIRNGRLTFIRHGHLIVVKK